jgi:hypothetical protein
MDGMPRSSKLCQKTGFYGKTYLGVKSSGVRAELVPAILVVLVFTPRRCSVRAAWTTIWKLVVLSTYTRCVEKITMVTPPPRVNFRSVIHGLVWSLLITHRRKGCVRARTVSYGLVVVGVVDS